MPVAVKCQRCGRIMYIAPSTAKRIKNCPNCKNSHRRKTYTVNEKEFKQILNKKMNLINWKSAEVAENNSDFYEELRSRYMVALYRNFARKMSLKNFNHSFHRALRYETSSFLKEVANKKEYAQNFIDEYNEDMDNKITCRKYLNDIEEYLIKNRYHELFLYYFCNSSKTSIGMTFGATEKAIDCRIQRQKRKVQKEFPEIVEYLK